MDIFMGPEDGHPAGFDKTSYDPAADPHLSSGSIADPGEQHSADTSGGRGFRAGTCYHCGGYGYTTSPSSGSMEHCWYCNGSGVAH
jgi:hypothetical protein